MENIAKEIREVLNGWEINVYSGFISAWKCSEKEMVVTQRFITIKERHSFKYDYSGKYSIEVSSSDRIYGSENFFNKKSRCIQHSGSLEKTIAKLQEIA